jgi:hypothetical protein
MACEGKRCRSENRQRRDKGPPKQAERKRRGFGRDTHHLNPAKRADQCLGDDHPESPNERGAEREVQRRPRPVDAWRVRREAPYDNQPDDADQADVFEPPKYSDGNIARWHGQGSVGL